MRKSALVLIYITSFSYVLHPVRTGIVYTSKACYGSNPSCTQHDLRCDVSQRIAIVDAYYTDNTECGSGLSNCGTVNLDSVTERGYHRFNINDVVSLYKSCSGKSWCGYAAPRRGDDYAFSVVNYRCIEKNLTQRISDGNVKILLSLGDTVESKCTIQDNTHACSFKSDINTKSISVYALDVRLRRRSPGQCLSQLSVITGNSLTMTNCTSVFKPFDRLNVTTELPICISEDLLEPSKIWLLITASDLFCRRNDLTTTDPTGHNTGAIAGGVVATVLVVLVVTLVSVWIIRRRRAEREGKENTASLPKDANPDMPYSLANNIPQNNYHEIQSPGTQHGVYDYATADGMVLPPTTNTYFIIEPAAKQTTVVNSTTPATEGDYDHIGDKPSPQTTDYDTTSSVAQPGGIGEDRYGYNHFQRRANTQTHQNDYDTAASATKAVAQISTTERIRDEDDYDHFQRGTHASETVSSPYNTT